MPLQGLVHPGRTAERIGQHGVGRLVPRGVLPLVAVLACGEEGTRDAVGPSERPGLRRVDRWTRDGPRLHTRTVAWLVLVGHPCSLSVGAHAIADVRRCLGLTWLSRPDSNSKPTGVCDESAARHWQTPGAPRPPAGRRVAHGAGSGTTRLVVSWARRSD